MTTTTTAPAPAPATATTTATTQTTLLFFLTILFLLPTTCVSWHATPASQPKSDTPVAGPPHLAARAPLIAPASHAASHAASHRRSFLLCVPALALLAPLPAGAAPRSAPDLAFTTTASGLQYADAKAGSPTAPSPADGQVVSVDYVMSTSGARYGSRIYSTVDAGAPYRWTLGDGSTIPGLEEAVRGMTPGGVRRVIIPAKLAYQASSASIRAECDGMGLGPIPPASSAPGEFQRFKNLYCNPDRVYQPDLVLDVKLYGKR